MLVLTMGVNEKVATDTSFAKHVTKSLGRFVRRDWGEMGDEDVLANDWAVENNERILAAYGSGADKVWIILEADRSNTTVLFPSEY
jgi:hypothetical protein